MIKQMVIAVSVVALAGCSAGSMVGAPGNNADPEKLNLAATSSMPPAVRLTWHVTEPSAAGQLVEYATGPNGKFAALKYLPPTATSYDHVDLGPSTTYRYRLRPYFGTASTSVELTLPPGEFDGDPTGNEEWMKPRSEPGPQARASVRAPEGAPTGFTAKMVHANGIKFTWIDQTTDEDGFLLEIKQTGAQEFIVGSALDPNVTSFGLVTLPAEKKAVYRLRAYKFGEPTNIVQLTTGS